MITSRSRCLASTETTMTTLDLFTATEAPSRAIEYHVYLIPSKLVHATADRDTTIVAAYKARSTYARWYTPADGELHDSSDPRTAPIAESGRLYTPLHTSVFSLTDDPLDVEASVLASLLGDRRSIREHVRDFLFIVPGRGSVTGFRFHTTPSPFSDAALAEAGERIASEALLLDSNTLTEDEAIRWLDGQSVPLYHDLVELARRARVDTFSLYGPGDEHLSDIFLRDADSPTPPPAPRSGVILLLAPTPAQPDRTVPASGTWRSSSGDRTLAEISRFAAAGWVRISASGLTASITPEGFAAARAGRAPRLVGHSSWTRALGFAPQNGISSSIGFDGPCAYSS